MTEITEGHTVKRYDGELGHLRHKILEMGALALDQVTKAVGAFERKDLAAAREVIAGDNALDRLQVELDEEACQLLARRQPLGRDLRMVIAVTKTITDLERVGDQAVKVAGLLLHMYDGNGNEPNQGLLRDVQLMGAMVEESLRGALEVFDNCDLERAAQVIQMQDRIDDEFQAALRRLTTFVLEDSRNVGHVISITLILKALGRIGGHADNIAKYVFYLVQGRDIRHKDVTQIAEQLAK